MGDRLKKLLDKATTQVNRSGTQKTVKFSNVKQVSVDNLNINALPVREIPNRLNEKPKKSKQIVENENDEIKAYLSQLSRKTHPELEQSENKAEKSQSEISGVSSLILEHEIKRKDVSKYTLDQDKENPKPLSKSTALERLSHYENKYLKSQPLKSNLLSSESDISFSDITEDKFDAKQTAVFVEKNEEIDENSSESEDVTSIKFEDLHFVDELPEIIEEIEAQSVEKSVLLPVGSPDAEVKSKISIIQDTSDETIAENNVHDVSTSSKTHTASQTSEISSPKTISSKILLQNVHFDTISTISDETLISETPTPPPTPQKIQKNPKPVEKPQTFKLKSQKSIGTQTNSDLTLNLAVKPLFGAELEPNTTSLTLTNLLIKQGTLDALTVTNPGIVALNELIKEQINFSKTIFTSRQHTYVDQISSLQPDYRYTTWDNTITDLARYKKKMRNFAKKRTSSGPT